MIPGLHSGCDLRSRTPEAGEYTLRVVTTFDQGVAAFRRDAPPQHTAVLRMNVR